jgi:DNA-binding MarR family transcriptional regulator
LLAEVYELAGLSRRQSDAEAAIRGSTAARWQTMSTISDTDLTVASIARRLGLPRQAVHRVVDDLITQGHVRKIANPDHQRSELVSLTPEGRTLHRQLHSEANNHRRELLRTAAVSDDELANARDVLRRIVAAFKDTGEEGT